MIPREGEPHWVKAVGEYLHSFVFFHLGADAQVTMERGENWMRVDIAHARVEPFRVHLTQEEAERLLDSFQLEEHLLLHLTRHRRHS